MQLVFPTLSLLGFRYALLSLVPCPDWDWHLVGWWQHLLVTWIHVRSYYSGIELLATTPSQYYQVRLVITFLLCWSLPNWVLSVAVFLFTVQFWLCQCLNFELQTFSKQLLSLKLRYILFLKHSLIKLQLFTCPH